ncbi:Glucose-6-phosphate 1-dehydrogenase [Ascosphaera pollenicola]|nr:Glucose-6-phosphate 1-dehydrogenase [Ascosphaera pollenicola]
MGKPRTTKNSNVDKDGDPRPSSPHEGHDQPPDPADPSGDAQAQAQPRQQPLPKPQAPIQAEDVFPAPIQESAAAPHEDLILQLQQLRDENAALRDQASRPASRDPAHGVRRQASSPLHEEHAPQRPRLHVSLPDSSSSEAASAPAHAMHPPPLVHPAPLPSAPPSTQTFHPAFGSVIPASGFTPMSSIGVSNVAPGVDVARLLEQHETARLSRAGDPAVKINEVEGFMGVQFLEQEARKKLRHFKQSFPSETVSELYIRMVLLFNDAQTPVADQIEMFLDAIYPPIARNLSSGHYPSLEAARDVAVMAETRFCRFDH